MTASRGSLGVPSETEAALLQVCFLPPGEAIRTWEGVGPRVSIEDLEPEAHGLFPLLHQRLVELGRRPPIMDKLLGVRRRLFVQNEKRMRSTRGALTALEAAGTQAALVGGAAVLVAHLGRLDMRPLHDVDVIVTESDAAQARGALIDAGWRETARWRDGVLLDIVATRFADPDGQTIVLRASRWAPYDDAIALAGEVRLGDDKYTVVCAADVVLQTIVDGARAFSTARVRWASDCLAVLLADEAAVDWERLVVAASARGSADLVLDALTLLDRLVPFGLSDEVSARLALAGSARPRRGSRGVRVGPPTLRGAYTRRTSGDNALARVIGWPAYLCEVWGLASPLQLPGEIASKAIARGRRRMVRA